MNHPGNANQYPEQSVTPETMSALKRTMNRWFKVAPPNRSDTFPKGPVVEAAYEGGVIQQDWESSNPNAIVSGQICDADHQFVVMSPLEGTAIPQATIAGEVVTPIGAIWKLATDPTDNTGESILSYIYTPTAEGNVFETYEGVYMSDEYLNGTITVRELGDQEVCTLVEEISAAYAAQVK